MDGRISNFQQVSSIRRYVLLDGQEKGLEVLDCDNGKIRFLLNVSKACDIMQLYHEGQNVSFISKNGFSKENKPFLNRFEGGMLYTCGLNSLGDKEGYEFHGTVHNIPATITRTECDEKGIVVEAILRDTALFGQELVLKRTIFTEMGSESITLQDTLVNEGYREENYCLLYHINVGYPMLDVGAKINARVKNYMPRSAFAKNKADKMFEISNAVPNQEEMCYFLQLEEPSIGIVNENLKKKLSISYSADTLPYFVEWKSMASGDYALGFEPSTSELGDKFVYASIKPMESITFFVKLSIQKQ